MSADVASDEALFRPIQRPQRRTAPNITPAVRKLATMTLKVLVLGEQECGKSSFVRAYIAAALRNAVTAGHGLPLSETHTLSARAVAALQSATGSTFCYDHLSAYAPTVGIDFWTSPVPVRATLPTVRLPPYPVGVSTSLAAGINARVVPVFYDASGDLTYVKVRAEAYGDWSVAFFCCDCSNRASFEQIQSWIAELDKFGGARKPLSVSALVMLKTDLLAQRGSATGSNGPAVSLAEGAAWARAHSLHFIALSSATGAVAAVNPAPDAPTAPPADRKSVV